jgi:hypothetical protein
MSNQVPRELREEFCREFVNPMSEIGLVFANYEDISKIRDLRTLWDIALKFKQFH